MGFYLLKFPRRFCDEGMKYIITYSSPKYTSEFSQSNARGLFLLHIVCASDVGRNSFVF